MGLFSFGSEAKTESTSKNEKEAITSRGEQRKRLEISDEGVQKIVDDILGADDGLAAIFAGEQKSGLYDSSVAAQEAGNFATNVVGEIAKLRAEEVTEFDEESFRKLTSQTNTSSASADVGFSI